MNHHVFRAKVESAKHMVHTERKCIAPKGKKKRLLQELILKNTAHPKLNSPVGTQHELPCVSLEKNESEAHGKLDHYVKALKG